MATINAVIATENDDAYLLEGGSSATGDQEGAGLSVGTGNTASSPDRTVAFRFQLPDIASGDTVDDAVFSMFKGPGGQWQTWQVEFFVEDADTSAALNGTDLSARSLTTNSVTENSNVNHADGVEYTVDLTAALQEVIDRAGWSANNYVSVICVGNGASSFAAKNWHSYGSGTAGQRAQFNIDYTAAGPTPASFLPPMRARRNALIRM